MKKILFGLVATVMFNFAANAEIKESSSINNLNSIENTENTKITENLPKFKFTITVGYGAFSVSVEVTCYRWSAHSPTYHCDYGTRTANNNDPKNEGYIDIEQLDKELLNLINEKNLTEIEIQKSESFIDDGNTLSIAPGKYEILKDENGRYLKVKVLVSK